MSNTVTFPAKASRTVRWGVLGAAAIAVGRTMPAMRLAPSATLLGLASRDEARAREHARTLGIERTYGSYDALLADPDIDAVYVPLPNGLHFEWSVRALEAGKHVLCEKPLCTRSQDVRELIAVRERTGRHVEEGFAYRNHPQWDEFIRLRDAGAIGRIRSMHATLAKRFMDPADIRNDPRAGGGALYDLGSYTLSAANIVFQGPPARVLATLDRCPDFGIDRLTSAVLDYGDRHALFTVGTQSGTAAWGTHQQLSVMGERGWMRFEFPFAHARPTACALEWGDEGTVGAFASQRLAFEPVNQYANLLERFSRRVLGQAVPAWPIEDSLDIARMTEALIESAQRGAWQAL